MTTANESAYISLTDGDAAGLLAILQTHIDQARELINLHVAAGGAEAGYGQKTDDVRTQTSRAITFMRFIAISRNRAQLGIDHTKTCHRRLH